MSPTIDRQQGFVFYFLSYDALKEPPHVHVGQGSQQTKSDAKIWLGQAGEAVSVARNGRFNERTIKQMVKIVQEQQDYYLQEWSRHANRE